MNDLAKVPTRGVVLHWAEQGAIPDARLTEALAAAGVTPDARQWRGFLDRLLLWSGSAFLAVATIFFVAFNWRDLGRYPKFGLVEALIAVSVAAYVKLGADRTTGKAALLVSAILMGTLLALFGQTYQTGADPWQLFAVWGVLIAPWVLIGRFAALWILWIAIANVAIILYFQVFPGFFGIDFTTDWQLWTLFAFDAAALAVWELAATRLRWLDQRWGPRLLAVASGGLITLLVVEAIGAEGARVVALLLYPIWLTAIYAVYRRQVSDLFMIAGGCLSVIVVVTVFLAQHVFRSEVGSLFIALAVVGMSAAAAVWLRRIATEGR